jgi:low affinity Fe/Cu permease
LTAKPTVSWPLPFTWTPPALAQLTDEEDGEIEEPDLLEIGSEDDPELMEDPQGQPNPFLDPALDDLVDKKISEDVWSQMLGDLPCSVATESCVNQLQNTAIQNSRLLADLQDKIDESIAAVEEARQKNLDSIAISNFSPFLQVFLYSTLGPVSNGVESPVNNPFRLILGNVAAAFLGQGLGSLFNWSQYAGNDSQQQRAIAIGDIQIKIAELQRNKSELQQKLREQVTVEILKLEELARAFQIEQAIAKRDKQRLEIARVSYRFGEGDSERYLAQLSSYDRQKAATFREWSRLRNQVVQVKLLVLGTGED